MKTYNKWDYFIRKISFALYAFYLTNKYGKLLKKFKTIQEKTKNRYLYCIKMAKTLGLNITSDGLDNIEENKLYVIAINHRSALDPVITEVALNKKLSGYWIAKEELSKSIFYKSFVNNGGTILVDRDSSSQANLFKNIKEAINLEQSNIFIFPEGTRNKTDDELSDFKSGINLIALKNKMDILPIYIEKHSDVLVDNAFKGIKQDVNVRIGKVIPYKTRNIQEEYKKTFNIL